MAALPVGTHSPPARFAASPPGERLGIPFVLLLIWVCFEFGRPPQPFGIPLLISIALCILWIFRKDKQWSRQSIWWLVLLGVMVLSVPFVTNTYSAYMTTKGMAILILCICLPLQSMVVSVKHVRVFVYTFLLVTAFVGGWAAFHGGYGPSGASGSQDENYVAALMGMAVPFAYFSLFSEKRFLPRILLGGAIVVYMSAVALGANPSRGGFIGLCAVGLYCISRSPRKLLGLGLLGLMGVSLLVIAGPAFWAEIGTSTDFQSGTGDVRFEIWKAGLRMWEANPIFGVGPGNFRWVIGDYQTAAQFAKFGRSLGGSIIAHSLFVEMIAELGIVGLLAAAMLVWRTWTDLGKVRDAIPTQITSGPITESTQLRNFADAIRASILAILVNGIFLSLFYYSHLWLLVALGIAVPFVYRRLHGAGPGGVAARPLSGRLTPSRKGRVMAPHAVGTPHPLRESGGRL